MGAQRGSALPACLLRKLPLAAALWASKEVAATPLQLTARAQQSPELGPC